MAPMSLGSLPPSERAFATLAVGAYLRRTAWPRRRLLMGGCALAVLFDAAQWWARQGRPEAIWAAWTALAALAAAMATLATVVLKELWTAPPRG